MFAENLKLFSKMCKLSRSMRGVMVEWDDREKKLKALSKTKGTLYRNLKFRIRLHSLAAFTVILQTLINFISGKNSTGKSSNTAQKFQSGLAAVVLIATNTHLRICRKQGSDLALYFNGLLQFVQTYRKDEKIKLRNAWRNWTDLERLNVIFAYAMYATGLILPVVFVYGLHWSNPCKPSLAGFWFIEECANTSPVKIYGKGSSTLVGKVVKVIILLFNHWVWAFAYSVTVFVISGLQILGAMSLRGYLKIYWNIYIETASRRRSMMTTSIIYRTIQVLARLTNILQQGAYMSVLIIAATLIQSVSSTSLVKLPWTEENLIPLGVFSITFIDASLACVVCLGGMAGVYLQSTQVFRNLNAHLCSTYAKAGTSKGLALRKEVRYQKRFLKSCTLIKLRFGGFNFVDELTPLNCINMANGLTVQLLLLGL